MPIKWHDFMQPYSNTRIYPKDPSLSAIYTATGIYMTDIDAITYDSDQNPIAVIEHKHGHIDGIDFSTTQLRCQANLAKGLQIPHFVTVYWHRDQRKRLLNAEEYCTKSETSAPTKEQITSLIAHAQYYVIPANKYAKIHLPEARMLSQHEWLSLNATLTGTRLRGTYSTAIDQSIDPPPISY